MKNLHPFTSPGQEAELESIRINEWKQKLDRKISYMLAFQYKYVKLEKEVPYEHFTRHGLFASVRIQFSLQLINYQSK